MTIGAVVTQRQTKLQRARVWLVMLLLDGPAPATAILSAGAANGFNKTILKRAGKGLVKHRHERAFGGQWLWELEPQMETEGVSDYREALIKKLLEATQ